MRNLFKKNPFGTLCVQDCCRSYLPCRRSCSGSVTAQERSFPYILGTAWTTEAFVSQHLFAERPVGRRKGRNASRRLCFPWERRALLCGGTELRGTVQDLPWVPLAHLTPVERRATACGCPHAHKCKCACWRTFVSSPPGHC